MDMKKHDFVTGFHNDHAVLIRERGRWYRYANGLGILELDGT
jgi:hypothetical protein